MMPYNIELINGAYVKNYQYNELILCGSIDEAISFKTRIEAEKYIERIRRDFHYADYEMYPIGGY